MMKINIFVRCCGQSSLFTNLQPIVSFIQANHDLAQDLVQKRCFNGEVGQFILNSEWLFFLNAGHYNLEWWLIDKRPHSNNKALLLISHHRSKSTQTSFTKSDFIDVSYDLIIASNVIVRKSHVLTIGFVLKEYFSCFLTLPQVNSVLIYGQTWPNMAKLS